MKKYCYFIIGLPRSRTAWLANFLTHDNSFCWHEASRYCGSIEELQQKMGETSAKYVGNSDSNMAIFSPEQMESLFWNARFVFIDRNYCDAGISYLKAFPQFDRAHISAALQKCQAGINAIRERVIKSRKLEFSFHALEDLGVLREIQSWCSPESYFDRERAEMLQQMRVDTIFSKMEKAMHPIYQEGLKKILRFQSVLP